MAVARGQSQQASDDVVVAFPDLKPGNRRALMGAEIGTQFDIGQRLFAYYGSGDVFDYGEWTARDMGAMFRRDGKCSALELVLTLPIREADYQIQPAKGDKGEAQLAHDILLTPDVVGGMKTPFQQLIGQITSAQVYRRAFFEKVWKINDQGQIIYDKISYRPPATCQARYDAKTAAAHGFRQQVWLFGGQLMVSKNQKVPGFVDIPQIRSYIYTHMKHRQPLTGASEMDVAYWCYQTKMKLLYLWYYFLENQALQRLVVYGNDQTEANVRSDDVASLKGSGVVGLIHPEPGQKAFEAIPSQGDAGQYFAQAMEFLEGWQIGSVLAGFMGLAGGSTGGKGSYALSQDQSSFYLKSRQAVSKEIAESVTYDIIRPLIMLNHGPGAAFPSFKFGPLQDEQIQALLTLFGQMAAAPVLHVPLPVFDLITERMATILQLDVDQVHDALTSTANQRAEQLMSQAPPGMPTQAAGQLGQLNGAVSAATNMIAQHQQQQQQQQGGQQGGQPPPQAMKQAPAPGQTSPPPKPPMSPPPGKMA
jgi:hypothetical protein